MRQDLEWRESKALLRGVNCLTPALPSFQGMKFMRNSDAAPTVLKAILLISLGLCSFPQWGLADDGDSQTFGVVTITREHVESNCPNPCDRDLVIFVHGIFGARDTWVNAKSKAYWPMLIAEDPDLASFDVARIDYESYLIKAGPSIEGVEKDLQDAIQTLNTSKYRTVQFIAHSLGGNLVRRYLLHVKASYGHKYLSRYRLVIMLGTPEGGSYLGAVAKLASHNQQLRVLVPIDGNDWLQMLNATIIDLRDKHQRTFCPSLKFAAAIETQPLFGLTVVPRKDAVTDADIYREFPRNHSSLVKPVSREDVVYKWTKDLMLRCSNGEICAGPHDSGMSPDCGNVDSR
jgi:pimeloyl-ACP methyl ester carboxylesterase